MENYRREEEKMNLYEKRDNLKNVKEVPFISIRKADVKEPIFSIAIPTFKRADHLKNTIESAINQDFTLPYEILAVDNNPERNDETEMAVAGIKGNNITYLKNAENVGMVGNWNRCLLASRGAWIVYCHDDDLLVKGALSSTYDVIKKNPDCKAVMPRLVQIDNPYFRASSNTEYTSIAQSTPRKILVGVAKAAIRPGTPAAANMFCDNIYGPPTCGMAVDKRAMVEYGGWWDPYIVSDWITMVGFSKKYKVLKNPNITGTYIWRQNTSLKEETIEIMSKERTEILRSLPRISPACRFYDLILRNDFKRKQGERMTVFDGKRSMLFKMIRRYYCLRIR